MTVTAKDTKENTMGLFSSGVPTAKFQQIGDSCVGRIVEITQQQRTEVIYDAATKTYKTGGPMFWSGGRPVADAATDPRTGQPNQPVMDGVVTVDTGKPDENGESLKRVIVKGKAEMTSVKQACIEAGVRDVEVGGMFKKTWVAGAGGLADPRQYEYRYKAPGAATSVARNPGVTEALDRMKRAHESSPVLNRSKATSAAAPNPGFEEEIPF